MNLSLQKLDGVNNSSDSKLQIKERVNFNILRSDDGSLLTFKKIPVYEGSDAEDALWSLKEVVPDKYYFSPNNDSWMCFEGEESFVSYTFGSGDKIENDYATEVENNLL